VKVNFESLTEINLENINLLIARLESMLEGKIDTTNIAMPDGYRLPIPSDNIVDLDGYINSVKVVAELPTEFTDLVDKIDAKLTKWYDLSTATLNCNIKRSRIDKNTSGSTSSQDTDTKHEGVSYTSLSRSFSIDKAGDFVPVTFIEFLELVYQTLESTEYQSWSQNGFIEHYLSIFLLEPNDFVRCTDVSFLTGKFSNIQVSINFGKIDFTSNYLSTDIGIFLDIPEATASDDYSLDYAFKERILMRRIL